jgi:CRP-like cAMP-binding protein
VRVDGDPDHLGARARRPMRRRDGKVDAVRRSAVFASASPDDARTVCRLMELVTVRSGAVLCTRGEPCREFVLVVTGRLAGQRADGVVVALRDGDQIGAAEIIEGADLPMTVRATADSCVLMAGRKQFEALLAEVEPFRRAIVADLARRACASRSVSWVPAPVRRLAWN